MAPSRRPGQWRERRPEWCRAVSWVTAFGSCVANRTFADTAEEDDAAQAESPTFRILVQGDLYGSRSSAKLSAITGLSRSQLALA
jgi:hypothetical protein